MARIVITLKDKEKEAWESFCSSQKMTGTGIISMRFNKNDVKEIEAGLKTIKIH